LKEKGIPSPRPDQGKKRSLPCPRQREGGEKLFFFCLRKVETKKRKVSSARGSRKSLAQAGDRTTEKVSFRGGGGKKSGGEAQKEGLLQRPLGRGKEASCQTRKKEVILPATRKGPKGEKKKLQQYRRKKEKLSSKHRSPQKEALRDDERKLRQDPRSKKKKGLEAERPKKRGGKGVFSPFPGRKKKVEEGNRFRERLKGGEKYPEEKKRTS